MTRYEHSGNAEAAVIVGSIAASGVTTIPCDSLTGWPTGAVGPFFAVIDRGLATEEKVLLSGRSGNVLNVAASGRGKDGTTAVSHGPNASIEHCFTALEADEANAHKEASSGVHGITGSVVGTTDTQTLTGKTIDGDLNTFSDIPQGAVTNLAADLAARPTTTAMQAAVDKASPIGHIVAWPGSTPPAGWLLCDGSTIAKATYLALWNVIGYSFGGAGSTFTLPDLRGRQILGVNGSHPLAQAAGAESTVLGMGQIPQHSHSIDHDHASFNTSGSDGAHTHPIDGFGFTGFDATGGQYAATIDSNVGSSRNITTNTSNHQHAIDVPALTGTSGNAGQASPSAVPTLDPFLALNFIIYTGV